MKTENHYMYIINYIEKTYFKYLDVCFWFIQETKKSKPSNLAKF